MHRVKLAAVLVLHQRAGDRGDICLQVDVYSKKLWKLTGGGRKDVTIQIKVRHLVYKCVLTVTEPQYHLLKYEHNPPA